MARPRTFDTTTALQQAIQVFWEKGYEGTSMGDLEEATGLGRQSLYNTFGCKRELYIKALSQYKKDTLGGIQTAFVGSNQGIPAIKSYMAGMIEFLTSPQGRRGCFITKSLLEQQEDEEILQQCAGREALLRDTFKKALQQSVANKTLPATYPVETAAMTLSTHVYGLNLMSKGGATRDSMADSTTLLLDQLFK